MLFNFLLLFTFMFFIAPGGATLPDGGGPGGDASRHYKVLEEQPSPMTVGNVVRDFGLDQLYDATTLGGILSGTDVIHDSNAASIHFEKQPKVL